MSYVYPQDPRLPWEWCPKCESWYEVIPDNYRRLPIRAVGTCSHDDSERRLSKEEVAAASRPAHEIQQAFRDLAGWVVSHRGSTVAAQTITTSKGTL